MARGPEIVYFDTSDDPVYGLGVFVRIASTNQVGQLTGRAYWPLDGSAVTTSERYEVRLVEEVDGRPVAYLAGARRDAISPTIPTQEELYRFLLAELNA